MKAQRIADLYSDYLLASFGATPATGLSELLEGEISHDQVTRYWAGTKKTATDLWRTVKSFVREGNGYVLTGGHGEFVVVYKLNFAGDSVTGSFRMSTGLAGTVAGARKR